MELTVQNINGLLMRSKLLTPGDVNAMSQRWQGEGKDRVGSMPHYIKWIVANNYLTEYQAGLIARGHADANDFFLGQYKILDRLGKGRMAGVYKAAHQSGQVVAIKVLSPSRSKDPQMFGRFEREARLAMQLKHPNVVRSFQVGAVGGLHFLVMEYLDGDTLEDVLKRRKKLPVNEAVRLVYQALQGLQHIHEKNFIHRDLKPANLMLLPARGPNDPDTTLTATVKILDIGLGRELFDESVQTAAQDLQLTGEGVLLGTPDYLAPEQARDPRGIDIRADIYSLGCVLYHCLAGQPPFPDSNVLNQMVRHATEAPRPVKELAKDVPDGLSQAINFMLAKEPKQRYPTPERAAGSLQMFMVAGAPVRPIDETPQMKKYLTSLEISARDDPKDMDSLDLPAKPAVAKSAPSAPAQAAHTPPLLKRNIPPGKTKAKHHKKLKKERQRKQVPRAQPAGAPPISGSEIDVELVALPGVPGPAPIAPAATAVAPQTKSFGLTKRDWILLGVGAGAVIVAVLVGFILAKM